MPRMEPSPPRRLQPPSTMAAIAYSTKKSPNVEGDAEHQKNRRAPGKKATQHIRLGDVRRAELTAGGRRA